MAEQEQESFVSFKCFNVELYKRLVSTVFEFNFTWQFKTLTAFKWNLSENEKCEIDRLKFLVKAGSFLFFYSGDISVHHPNSVHGSLPNKSNKRRGGLTLRYVPNTTLVDVGCALEEYDWNEIAKGSCFCISTSIFKS